MSRLSVHLRISSLSPSDEDVNSRQKAVTQLVGAWSKIKAPEVIISKVAEIAIALGGDGTPPAALSSEVEGAIQKHAAAFLGSERPLEVGICSGVAILSVMGAEPGTLGWSIADVYSNSLWLALSFQPALHEQKREALRSEVLDRARVRSLESANNAREREVVPEASELEIAADDKGKPTTNFKKVITAVIDPLRRNAALDREELDFLWWAQLSRSRLLDRALSDIPEATRLVTMGIEGAGLLRRMPADVHREIVLRTVNEDPELNLKELIDSIGDADRAALVEHIADDVTSSPIVYPLLNALVTGETAGEGATERRKASTWGSRALLETKLQRMVLEGAGRL